MNLELTMRAPLGVQLNRVAFLVYAALFSWPLWAFRHTVSAKGIMVFGAFVTCSLLGLGYSFVRIPRSRWVVAILALLIPVVFWGLMCLFVFSRPAWWEWPLALFIWFAIPVSLAASLFRDEKARDYFTA
jgi:hypothetical protein